MKYNLLIMVNNDYMNFAIICLNSLYKNTNIDNIHNIIINDIGLSDENKNYLKNKYSKIEFYNSNFKGIFTEMHSNEWLECLTYKTKILLEIIKNDFHLPIVMLDSDTIILEDFSSVIDNKYDIQVCKREKKSHRPDLNMYMEYIASFFIINNNTNNVIDFMNEWIKTMNDMHNKNMIRPYETPSLCKILTKCKEMIHIGELDEINICADSKYIKNVTKIIHMKSRNSRVNNNTIEQNFYNRINNINNFSKDEVLSYLDKKYY